MKNKAPLIASVLVIVVFLFCTTARVAYSSDSINLHGTVTDENGVPLQNCAVTVFSSQDRSLFKNTMTDAAGYYQLVVPSYTAYTFCVEWKGGASFAPADYIPIYNENKSIKQAADSEIDFKLKAGANIKLQVYDNDGNLIRNKDFNQLTDKQVFMTDLKDIPNGSVQNIDGIYENPNQVTTRDSSVPSFVVLPGSANKIHIQWEVPKFGKIILSADNEGKGYSVDTQGGQLVLNFNYEAAKSHISALQKDYDDFKNQGYDISSPVTEGLISGQEHLKNAEKYLFETESPDMKSAVAELDRSLKDALTAHELLYLDRAEADIEKYRQGDALIKITDEKGTPLENCNVSYQETTHDFKFSVATSQHNIEEKYITLLKEAGINCMYMTLLYGDIQPVPGVFTFTNQDMSVDSELNKGFKLIGNASWFFYRAPWEPTSRVCPAYLDDMSFDEVKANVYQFMYAIADRYKGKIDDWEAIFEPALPHMNTYGWSWNQKLEIYTEAVSGIKDANPDALIYMKSDYNPPYAEFASYQRDKIDFQQPAQGIPSPELIPLLTERVPLDVIGIHVPNAGVEDYAGSQFIAPALDLVSISDLIDQYAQFGKPVLIREHQAPSTQVEGGNWWHHTWNEQTQAEYVKAFYTLVFSKPLTYGAGWSTGVVDDEAVSFGCISGGLLHSDLTPKPAYYTLQELINSWTTAGSGKTDQSGEFKLRGFAGDYNISVQTSDGRVVDSTIHINEQKSGEFTITVPATTKHTSTISPKTDTTAVIPGASVEPQPTGMSAEDKSASVKNNNELLFLVIPGSILIIGFTVLLFIRKRIFKKG